MTEHRTLTITALISLFLMTLHVSDDIVRGYEPGGFKHAQTIVTFSVWFYPTLMRTERRGWYVLMLLGSMLGMLVAIAHMRGSGMVGGRVAGSNGMLLWVFTMLSLGVTSTFSAILSAKRLWSLRRSTPATSPASQTSTASA